MSSVLITRRTLLTQAAFLALGAGVAIVLRDHVLWPPPRLDFTRAGAWARFTGPGRDPLAVIDIELAGIRTRALIDTGAQVSVIDRAYAQARGLDSGFGPPMVAYGVGGGAQVVRGVRVDMALAGLTVAGLTMAAADLGPVAGPQGLGTPVIIGQDVLVRTIADIDFLRRRIAFRPPEGYVRPAGAVAAPVRRNGRSLLAHVVVEGHPLDVVVDTGANGFLALTRQTAERSGLLDGRPLRPSESIVLGGVHQGFYMTVRRLGFGAREWLNIPAHVFPAPPTPGFPAGLLGVEVFGTGRAIFDIQAGRMDLLPSAVGKGAPAS